MAQARRWKTDCCVVLVLFASTSSIPVNALAGNAFNLTGYGTESTYMGGADVAVSRDAFAVNNNPAGLSQILHQALDINMSIFHAEGASHSDSFGSYRRVAKNNDGVYGNLGYAKHIPESPYTFGMALVLQGGLGWVYKNMDTVFATRDETTSLFSVFKLVPAIGWKVNEQLSLGGSIGLNYASGAQTLFPNTSAAPSAQFPLGFSGINLKDVSGYGLNAKLGMQYRPVEDVVIGVTYGTKTKLPLKGGSLRVNYTNSIPGQGVVRYDDVQIKGFALPQEIAIGMAFRPIKPLLISIQNKWYDWSDSSKSNTLIAKSPRSAGVPQEIRSTTQIGALDQHVYSIGVAYDYDEKTTLMAGANYGRRNIPEQNLAPTFQLIQQMHYMAGVRRKIDQEWTADIGIERLPQQMVTYNNPNLPFGQSVANHSGTILHLQASRRWQ